jgi:hypothetical protein
MLDGESRRSCPRHNSQLVVDRPQVLVDRPAADEELLGHLSVSKSSRNQPEDIDFADCQPGWIGCQG